MLLSPHNACLQMIIDFEARVEERYLYIIQECDYPMELASKVLSHVNHAGVLCSPIRCYTSSFKCNFDKAIPTSMDYLAVRESSHLLCLLNFCLVVGLALPYKAGSNILLSALKTQSEELMQFGKGVWQSMQRYGVQPFDEAASLVKKVLNVS